MLEKINRLIAFFFYTLFFLTPLVFYPSTSELFEFNKMVLTYALTIILVSLWAIRIILEKRFIFRRTILDIPLLLFLSSQFLSTILSIDFRTSLLGYYSRFHGGFLSSFSYSFLYWAFVSNMSRTETEKSLRALLSSTVIVSIWAIFEHFGHSFSCLVVPEFHSFDVSCWVQDVQNRVYATLGQPNWLAAWIVAIIPLTWAYGISNFQFPSKFQITKLNKFLWLALSCLFFFTILFTKSRSGLLAFAVTFIVFWITIIAAQKFKKSTSFESVLPSLLTFVLVAITTSFITLLAGTPWTPKLKDLILNSNQQLTTNNLQPTTIQGPALESGGTESEKIRAIVWKGAIEIWKHYPILGTGVETFAYSYYNFRPVEHNLVSEWDYLYNKAHNEYLNMAATTGTIGLIAYLSLIVFSLYQISNFKFQISKQFPNPKSQLGQLEQLEIRSVNIALFSGFVSILVTNFFGFSVVPVAILFFLYPAIAVTLVTSDRPEVTGDKKINSSQTFSIILVLLVTCYLLLVISRYWYADLLYAHGKLSNDAGDYIKSSSYLQKAIKISSKEATFWSELAKSSTFLAISAQENSNIELAQKFASQADLQSGEATSLSPANVNLKRDRASFFIKLSLINPQYMLNARDELEKATHLAPTEAKLFYNLGITYLRLGDYQKAIEIIKKTTEMKSNYKDAHYALGLIYIDSGEKEKAKNEFDYILKYISPDDKGIQRELEELK